MIEFGFGRADISVFEPGMCMMGWGQRTNRAFGVAAPLSARAMFVRDPDGDAAAMVTIETLLVTQGLWYAVVDTLESAWPELGLGPHNVILTATHTHSGPSGFGHHFWTNLNAPGFSEVVFQHLRDAIVDAIVQAWRERRPGTPRVAQTVVPLGEGVAYNRSWFAYNRNRDVEPVTRERRDEATDRVMTVLRFEDADGATGGLVNWFALHGTCVHADNERLHPDHKGLAALELEAEGVPVIFAQECCGDVSPNYRWDARRGHTIGRYDDDLRSAEHVAGIQLRHTRRLLQEAGRALGGGPVRIATRTVDFQAARVDARWSPDERERATTPAQLGISMAQGTAEGPGPLRQHRWLTGALNALAGRADRVRARLSRRYQARHDPKFPFIDLGRGRDGRLAGLLPMRVVPPVDPTFKWVRDAVKRGGVEAGPWVPQVVPLQLLRIGSLVIAALPFEMTTVSGRRLRETLRACLPDTVEHIVISPYASAYVGYLTTFEEYQVQHYEAGYTLFGPFTLGAVRTAFADLAGQLERGVRGHGPAPPRVRTAPLERIAFQAPWPD